MNFVKFSRTPFFIEHVWWLHLFFGKRLNGLVQFLTFHSASTLLEKCSLNFDLLSLKNLSPGQFWGAPTHADIIDFQFKNQRSGSKTVLQFCYFNFERNYDVLKSESSYILLNQNINFNKSETESKLQF